MRGSILVLALVMVGGCDRGTAPVEQGNSTPSASAVTPDEVAPRTAAPATIGFDRSHHGEAAPDFAFTDAAGKSTTLAAFRGKPVLVNLWATWCGPCVKELPTLDRLAAKPNKFAVVALSQDVQPARVATFVAAHAITALPIYTDAKMAWLPAKAATLPTTILYDASGHEVWRRTGDLDWTGVEAAKALAEG